MKTTVYRSQRTKQILSRPMPWSEERRVVPVHVLAAQSPEVAVPETEADLVVEAVEEVEDDAVQLRGEVGKGGLVVISSSSSHESENVRHGSKFFRWFILGGGFSHRQKLQINAQQLQYRITESLRKMYSALLVLVAKIPDPLSDMLPSLLPYTSL